MGLQHHLVVSLHLKIRANMERLVTTPSRGFYSLWTKRFNVYNNTRYNTISWFLVWVFFGLYACLESYNTISWFLSATNMSFPAGYIGYNTISWFLALFLRLAPWPHGRYNTISWFLSGGCHQHLFWLGLGYNTISWFPSHGTPCLGLSLHVARGGPPVPPLFSAGEYLSLLPALRPLPM